MFKKKLWILAITVVMIPVLSMVGTIVIKFFVLGEEPGSLPWIVGGIGFIIGFFLELFVLIYAITIKPAKLFRRKRYQDLILYLEKAVVDWPVPKNMEEYYELFKAVALFELGRDKEFLTRIEQISYQPVQGAKNYYLTVYYVMQEDKERAASYYELFKETADPERDKKQREVLEVLCNLDSYENTESKKAAISSILSLTKIDRIHKYLSALADGLTSET